MTKRKDTHRLTVYLSDDAWKNLNDNLNTSFTTSNSYGARSELVSCAISSYFQQPKLSQPIVYDYNILDSKEEDEEDEDS